MFKLQGVSPLSETTLVDAIGTPMEPGTIVALSYGEYDPGEIKDRKISIGAIAKVKHSAVDVAIVSHRLNETTCYIRQYYPYNLISMERAITANPTLQAHVVALTGKHIDYRWPVNPTGRRFAVVTVNEKSNKTDGRWYGKHQPALGVDSVAVIEVFGSTARALEDAVTNINNQGWFTSGGALIDPNKPVYRRVQSIGDNKWWVNDGYFTLKNRLLSTKTVSECGLLDYVNHVMSLEEFNDLARMHNPSILITAGAPYAT